MSGNPSRLGDDRTSGSTDPWPAALRFLATPLSDGRTIIEHTVVDGVTYWWFFDHLFRQGLLGRMQEDSAAARVARSTARTLVERFPLMPLAHSVLGRDAKRRARAVVGPEAAAPSGPIDVLFTAQNRMWRDDHDTFWGPAFDALVQAGVDRVATTYPMQGVRWPWPGGPGESVVRERRAQQRWPHVPFDLMWSPSAAARERTVRQHLARAWRRIRHDEVLADGLAAFGDRAPTARNLLRHAFCLYLPRFGTVVHMAERLMQTYAPEVVVLLNEGGSFERALVVAAKQRGIATIALQHGVIHPRHPCYILPHGAIAPDGSVSPPNAPIPDETCLYGSYHEALLNEAGYPPQALAVTGHPKSDALRVAADTVDRGRSLRGLGLDPQRPTVVWTTQTHAWVMEENEAYRRAIAAWLQAAGDDVQTLIKLHPGEDATASFYRAAFDMPDVRAGVTDPSPHVVARSRGFPAVVVDAALDTIETMAACDLVITKNSTTGLEAVALGKPLLVLNLGGAPDLIDYVEKGVARGVYDEAELPAAILALLDDDADQARHRAAYLARYLGPMDGHAVDRFVARVIAHIER